MASIPDNYEINVAKKRKPDDAYGVHFCKIQLSNEWNDEMAEKTLQFFRELFGEEYHVSMRQWICRGKAKEGWK